MRCWCAPPICVVGGRCSESLLPSSQTLWPRAGLGDRLTVSVSQQAGRALSRLAGQSLNLRLRQVRCLEKNQASRSGKVGSWKSVRRLEEQRNVCLTNSVKEKAGGSPQLRSEEAVRIYPQQALSRAILQSLQRQFKIFQDTSPRGT